MAVAGHRIGGDPADDAAGDDDRQLGRERQLGLGEQRLAVRPAEARQRAIDVVRSLQPELAAAVVATGRDLQPERETQGVGGLAEVGRGADLAPWGDVHARGLEEPPLGDPVLGDMQRQPSGPDGPQLIDRIDDLGRDVLELIGHDVAQARESKRRPDVVIGTDDDPIRDAGSGAIGIGVEDDDAVAHRSGGEADHPTELAPAEDADRGRRRDRPPLDAELAMDVGDPGLLAVGVLMRLDGPAFDDPGLQRGVTLDEGRVGEQRVAERHVAVQLLAVWQDVAMDPELGPGTDDRSDEHRPAGRPWIGPRLTPEPQLVEHRRHDGDVIGGRRDREVDDALAWKPRDRGAADVLDDEVRAPLVDQLGDGRRDLQRPGVPRFDRRDPSLVRSDRWVHRGSVDCGPMRQVIGRRTLEVDVG